MSYHCILSQVIEMKVNPNLKPVAKKLMPGNIFKSFLKVITASILH